MDENIKVKCETEVFGESKSSWLNDIDELVTCSRCGFSYPLRELLMLRRTYCRNCGAELDLVKALPSAQPEDYAELKKEFLRMASYIDVLLECPDEQKETLMGFISRLAKFMPWTEKD